MKFIKVENQIKCKPKSKLNHIFLILAIISLSNLFFSCRSKINTEPIQTNMAPSNPCDNARSIVDKSIFIPGTIDYHDDCQVANGMLNGNQIISNRQALMESVMAIIPISSSTPMAKSKRGF